ncbi:MAG TPA: hypothetical protein VJU86_23385 [Pyrinomonadaceae bacterium]|nr:hypothetical protein [Pyrinomonadaceae bacterium]
MKNGKQQLRWPTVVFVALLLAATGCNPVISKRPVGPQPARIVAAEWEGNWIGPDGGVAIKVVDAYPAILKVAWREDDGGKRTMKTALVELRESGDWFFANTRAEGEGNGYLWARVKKEKQQILIWEPDNEAFTKLVNDGVLPGRIDQKKVTLEELDTKKLSGLQSGDYGVPFKWSEPLILFRPPN